MRALTRLYFLGALVAFHILTLSPARGELAETLEIDGGWISGTVTPGDPAVHVYKGIPFAAPPVGDLRWKAPQPVKPWEGVKACTEFGPGAYQLRTPLPGSGAAQVSEDCLYLNVWTPANDAGDKLPVMVWIHGGGFITGSASIPNGEALARKGVVLVTIHYRLGPFGFMAHPALSKESGRDSSGNYGLMDQAAALRWVRENIAAFGGDPGRVTIFGQSAGSVSVSLLMVNPSAKGLFHRAIAESGAATLFPVRYLRKPRMLVASAEAQGEAICKRLGCDAAPDPLAAMRAKSPSELLAAGPMPVLGGDAIYDGKALPFWPVIDGDTIPDDPGKIFAAGKQQDVPFIMGTNADEGGMFMNRLPNGNLAGYETFIRASFGKNADEALAFYSAADVPAAKRGMNEMMTEVLFMAPTRRMAVGMAGSKSPAFVYHFTKTRVPGTGPKMGPGHSAEIPYVFGWLDAGTSGDDADLALSETMMSYWTNFAAKADPNGEGLPQWAKYDAKQDNYIEFGETIESKSGLRKDRVDFLERWLTGLEVE